MHRRRLTETDLVRAWNFYHPEALRSVPSRVPREPVPPFLDRLDALLALYILQATLDG